MKGIMRFNIAIIQFNTAPETGQTYQDNQTFLQPILMKCV